MSEILMIKKVNEHIGFHYLPTEIQLYNLIYLEFKYILQEVLNKIKDKSIAHNIFRIQDNGAIVCEFYCIDFIECILGGKTLLN